MKSAYEIYQDDNLKIGVDKIEGDKYLSTLAYVQDTKDPVPSGFVKPAIRYYWGVGDIFRIRVRRLKDEGTPLRIYTLKMGYKNYRFGDSIEQLEHIAMLHGILK